MTDKIKLRGVTCGECELHETKAGARHIGPAGCSGPLVMTRWGYWCPQCKFHPTDDNSVEEWVKG